MNTIWSDHVQGVKTLYLSRKLRFDDLFFSQYEASFQLDGKARLKILEIGCGPGALAEALHRWYPHAEITAIDRDRNFISFAKKNVPCVDFTEADATNLPFEDSMFDVTISNTVQEHIAPEPFWGEQLRVLKPGGVCICLSARKGLRCIAPCLQPTAAETAFRSKLPPENESLRQYEVCRFPMSEAELPRTMEAYGFRNVTTGYAVIDLTPDAPKYSAELATAMIEADRQCDLEAIASAYAGDTNEVVAAVNSKYDERLRLYKTGNKQWDTAVSVTMILRGTKPFA